VAHRVLVVDDVDEVRVLIRRVLQTDGYEVDEASSLDEARAMSPAGYDAVLVDAHLGEERGIDLVDELRSADPAAAGRCLVITGGALDALPDDIACLVKPFQRGDLLEAVRTLRQPNAGGPSDQPAVVIPAPAPRPAAEGLSNQPIRATASAEHTARVWPRNWQMLDISRQRRARERLGLTDFLHDGPVQELTAAILELQMRQRAAPGGQAPDLDGVLHRLDAAAGFLRWLIGGEWPPAPPEANLADAVAQQTAWLLATDMTVEADEALAGPGAAETPVIADVVELLLLAIVPPGLMARAHVAVRAEESAIAIDLTVTPADDHQAIGDPAVARESIDALAEALAASAQSDLGERRWRVRLVLRRCAG
jgi:CheY-like chemotaxis protein